MATLTLIGTPGFFVNMDAFGFGEFSSDAVGMATDTTLALRTFGPLGHSLLVQGAGFTYDGSSQFTGGTVGEMSWSGQVGFDLAGLSVPAAMAETWFQTDLHDISAGASWTNLLAGDDSIQGSVGSDLIRGFAGNDVIWGAQGSNTIYGGAGDDTIYGGSGGGDWLVGGQGNDLITAHTGGNILYGNLGDDTLHGGSGAELLRGGQGDDVIQGGGGNDWISGDRGSDTLTGGTGADIFHSFSGAGVDRVTEFNLAEGDRVQLDPGTSWTVSQVGNDTVIDMGAGDQMILVGVQSSTLTGSWIFA
jgi:Ca2+-binding RTX toxin-like protein